MYDFNVFDELEHKQIEENGGVPEQVHENLKGSIRLFSLIGNCMELFIPKFLVRLMHFWVTIVWKKRMNILHTQS